MEATKIFLIFSVILFFGCGRTKSQDTVVNIENQTDKEQITYYTYGEIPPVNFVYYDTVIATSKYRLNIKNLGGCEPINVDYDTAEVHNAKTARYMSKTYGKNWVIDFEKETGLKLIIPN